MADLTETRADVRELVRERYAAAATAIAEGAPAADPTADSSCCGPASAAGSSCCAPVGLADAEGNEVFGGSLYDAVDGAAGAPVQASLGCGVPTAVVDLRDGEVVLDLGSGAGADVLISARRVAPSGRAIGLDMTDEMLALARANAAAAGVENVEFVKGYLEDLPLRRRERRRRHLQLRHQPLGRQVARAARGCPRPAPGRPVRGVRRHRRRRHGRRHPRGHGAWTGCVAGALTRAEFERSLAAAGLVDVEIRETHRVHEHAAAAIVRARKP